MDPRYQVFISSTFRDLKDERQAVLAAVLELGHFPAGMEAFPAASVTPWDLIKKIISESDYYVLIIGARYGSTDEKGVSYTEREYDLACELEIPTLIFLHGAPALIPAGKVEMDRDAQDRLAAFRTKVERHHCKTWKSPEELKANVALGLIHEIRVNPRLGWIRGDQRDSPELLRRLNGVLEQNAQLTTELTRLQNAVAGQPHGESLFAHGDEIMPLGYGYSAGNTGGVNTGEINVGGVNTGVFEVTWKQLFKLLAPHLMEPEEAEKLKFQLILNLRPLIGKPIGGIADEAWKKIVLQFVALGYWEAVQVNKKMVGYSVREPGVSAPVSVHCYKLTALGVVRFAEGAAVLRRVPV
ncbi:DUF4062 domain-containing protein [Prosthecobacter sp.]|uniref:DUF4062 domain-containing protein n=1 Tax=Prosthecobacter sp. TaxID=1965333 RepID=UPI003784E334